MISLHIRLGSTTVISFLLFENNKSIWKICAIFLQYSWENYWSSFAIFSWRKKHVLSHYWLSAITYLYVCYCWCLQGCLHIYVLFFHISSLLLVLLPFALQFLTIHLAARHIFSSAWRYGKCSFSWMALSLDDSFDDLKLDNLDDSMELEDLEPDDLNLFSVLSISSPSFCQLWILCLD